MKRVIRRLPGSTACEMLVGAAVEAIHRYPLRDDVCRDMQSTDPSAYGRVRGHSV